MFILSFYLFWGIITYLFGGIIFRLDFNDFNDPIFYLLVLVSLLIGMILSFVIQLSILSIIGSVRKDTGFESKFNHRVANSCLNLAIHLLRVKVKTFGKENIPQGKFVMVSNHQENYDVIVLKPIFKNHTINFIAKEAVIPIPVIGKWIILLGNTPISRYADRSAAKTIIKAINQVKGGMSMGVFPEGRRSFGNELIAFKPGAFKLAIKPKADILITTIYNFSNILKDYPFKKQIVYVNIHKLLKYEDYKELSSIELAKKVKGIMQIQLDKFEEEYGKKNK
ncbi:MAG: 1-acyl-sn-glycerol-3-phosphate acyltransferase [Candidatus Izimaplasma sp.]|nr:1-acyl-sn-glycerol-3-phosphate acyltransferase [Candidatus Izimaplasma bacterium]